MASSSSKLTLWIEARLKDSMTKEASAIEKGLATLGLGGLRSFQTLSGAVFNLKTALLGIVGTLGLYKAVSIGKSVAEDVDQLGKLAASTGDVVENISELREALKFAGGANVDFEGSLKELVKAQREALDKTGDARDAFQGLGITFLQLRNLGPSQLFEEIARGLGQFNTEQEQAAALSKLLPRQFLELLPVLGGGVDKLQTAVRAVREFGATVTDQQTKIGGSLNDAFSKLGIVIDSIKRSMLEAFGPEAIGFLETLAKHIAANKGAIVDFAKALGQYLLAAIQLASQGLIGLVKLIEKIPGTNLLGDDPAQKARVEQLKKRLQLAESNANTVADDSRFEAEIRRSVFAELDAARKALAEAQGKGLGDVLQEQKDAFVAEIKKTVDQLQQNPSPATPDAAAQAYGLPTITTWEQYAAAMNQAMGKVADSAQGAQAAAAAGGKRSEFLDTPSKSGNQDPNDKATEKVETLGEHITSITAKWRNFGAAGKEAADKIIDGGLDHLSDALASVITGAKSMKEAFRDFAKQVLEDLAKVISKLIIMKALETILGVPEAPAPKADGGVVPAYANGGVHRYAAGGVERTGGIARRPTVLFGEGRNAEAFVPLPDNRSIPVSFVGGGAPGGTTQVQVNITAMDSKDVARVLSAHQGLLFDLFAAQVSHGVHERGVLQGAIR